MFCYFVVILFVDVNYVEILSILRYVNRVKNIINKFIVNEVSGKNRVVLIGSSFVI